MADVTAWIEEIKLPGIRVMTEVFGPGKTLARAAAQSRPARSRVNFKRSGRSLEMNGTGSLLDLVEAEGVPVQSDCRSGVCGACATKVISGEVGYDFEPIAPLDEGEALLCCGFPLTGELVLDL
jgi:ferredoxin